MELQKSNSDSQCKTTGKVTQNLLNTVKWKPKNAISLTAHVRGKTSSSSLRVSRRC